MSVGATPVPITLVKRGAKSDSSIDRPGERSLSSDDCHDDEVYTPG